MTHSTRLRVILSKAERTKVLLRLLSFFILFIFFSGNAWASTPKILLLKDLEPGTKAIGFSVFKGVEPQPFDVVLGEPIDQAGNSFILVRISGGPMDTPLEKIGAIHGMSGSPIFTGCINKKLSETEQYDFCISQAILEGNSVFLAGALSYAVGSFIEGGPNALITPAEYMLGARVNSYAAASSFSNGSPNKINIGGREFANLMLFPKMEDLAVTANPAGRCQESIKSDIKPGSMVTVFFATGAVNVGGSGTVIWRDDDKMYIFGHPLMGTGMVNYPFVQISVADTLQTPLNAQKLPGCHLDAKGAMLVDGAFEMAGVVGRTAPMLPYQVDVRLGNSGAVLYEEIAASPMAAAIIKQLPVIWAEQSLGDLSHYSLFYQARITITDQPEIFVKNFVPAQVYKNPFEEVFNRVYGPIEDLRKSEFNYGLESVKVRLDFVKEFRLWTAKRSFLSPEKPSSGDTVYVNVVLEEYFSSVTKQISIPIKIPEDFTDQASSGITPNLTIHVQGGSKFTDKRERPEVNSIEDLIRQLNNSMNYKNNVLYVQRVMSGNKAEQEDDMAKAKAAVKPAGKWVDVERDDLKQLPRADKNNVALTVSSELNDFIDLNLTFNLQVQPKKDATDEDKKETKKRKRFLFF
ncbi:MAG: hypothetical protein A3I26_01790 [Candidatus Yanofskybacteria bacterium RIFCSPLOWO2_02_FULL_43_10]|uniref:Peptidase S55 domain-containing protein n=1 Tax=Candidatus Yanofskybacteria bacterium RIFCSPLOWO2_12_FULL_43_11b TaxID=1802710 RepID=A0A1F8HAI5_9BACT|nr:MAG: hypothetical protein A2742_02960 [Candidatus Yanofskybacteria bacterium RIFCSPHIGHO2_01_FULL_43_32]OGN11146.1 MAG: hypothetical protein A3C69_01755 [Candidatus Yanofskybacteria bacterium RIFCSPHIGHO2_02_FULL_43_12]OGN25115.1 MAG: hypothetical protein A2923_01915 [Candidatus Yanofskybacteria bacterium RIFCSPLOWO2_01_FULL_43_46]OGN29025.1 MAG: hypothetical protein A3I26_01790 [Candidatus Yanofskybacteria bacterium RIFCSPLOWO2_02_FULL_43_10]OGN33989.1 MAG: hypothetical protein A3G51_00670 